jgi:5'-nucleotidase
VTASPLRILVTNDDGVGSEGIDALVQGLRGVADVEITVVAPLEDMSGTGRQISRGRVTATATTTQSGFPATAVDGFPADTVIYAVKRLDLKPDLVMSGINAGANLGAISYGSGTVGAAMEAGLLGIPSVAFSQGDSDASADYASGAVAALTWLEQHRDSIAARRIDSFAIIESVNIPTCTSGVIRGTIRTKLATTAKGALDAVSDCASTLPVRGRSDITAFARGFITVAWVPNPRT